MATAKLYYHRNGITILHGDCRELLAHPENLLRIFVPDAEHGADGLWKGTWSPPDVVITDPPFGIADKPIVVKTRKLADGTRVRSARDKASASTGTGKRRGKGTREGRVNTWHKPSPWDRELDPSWLPEAMNLGPVALFGHWRKRTAFEAVAGMEPRCEIVWAKDTHVGPQNLVAARDERIWIFSRRAVTPQCFDTSVWDEPIIPTFAHRRHKNEKPVALMRRLIRLLPGKLILDPFMGSGSTLEAAQLEGRACLGIEADEEHCEAAAKRLQQGVLDFGGSATGTPSATYLAMQSQAPHLLRELEFGVKLA